MQDELVELSQVIRLLLCIKKYTMRNTLNTPHQAGA